MPRRIDLGRVLLAVGAALLFVSLFIRWYDTGATAWDVFEALDLMLAGLALAALALALWAEEAPPWAAVAVPVAAAAIVAVQLINPPPAAANADPSTGAWLALGATLVMVVGGALALAAISITMELSERQLHRRRVAAVDRRADGLEPEAPIANDLDRTQPLSVLPDEPEGTERR